MLLTLAKISPLDALTGARVDVRVAGFSARQWSAEAGINGQTWEPAMTTPPTIGISLFNGDYTQAVDAASASLPLNINALNKGFPGSPGQVWVGAPVEIYAGEPGQAWPWPVVFAGRVTSYGGRAPNLTLQAEVSAEPFAKTVLTATYAGSGGAEGGDDLRNRLKPLVLGWAKNVEPVLVDAVNNVYQFSGYGAIEDVTTLYERASAFSASTGDHVTYAALVAATIAPGQWATCLAAGMIRLGAPQAGVITGDIKGHKVGGATPRLTGAIINALATIAGVSSGAIETASLSAMDVDKPYPINLVLTDQTSFVDIARRLAIACNWQAGLSLAGKFFASDVGLSGAEQFTMNARGATVPQVLASEELDVSPPYAKTIMGANRCWRVHSADEIAWSVPLVYKGAYDAATTYREGDWVDLEDGSTWLYINPTPSAGNAPPTWPATSNTWWDNLSPPLASAEVPTWVLDAATNFNADNDNNGLVPPAATGVTLASTLATDASASLSAAWTYTNSSDPAAANNIDGFLVGFYPQTTSASWTYSSGYANAIIWQYVEADRRQANLAGQPADKFYWAVVIPYRAVHTNIAVSGKVTGPAAQNAAASGHRPTATPNYLGNLGGTIASLIASATTNFNLDNDGNSGVPSAATGLSISSTQFPDSTCSVSVGWTFFNSTTAGDPNNIDGFLIGLYAKSSSASWTYSPGTVDNVIDWQWAANANVRGFTFTGKPVNQYYWAVIIPYRRVRADVNVNRIILGTAAQTAAGSGHRPAASPTFTGNIDFLAANLVAIGSNRAGNAIDASNNIAANKVLQASIIAGAISETDYASQSGMFGLATSDSTTQTMIANAVVGSDGRLLCRFVPPFRITKTGPVQGATYQLDLEIVLTNAGGTVLYASNKYSVKERWDSPTVATLQTMEQRVGVVEHYFSGIPAGTYGVGWRASTPASNSAEMPAYRYMTARAPRADE